MATTILTLSYLLICSFKSPWYGSCRTPKVRMASAFKCTHSWWSTEKWRKPTELEERTNLLDNLILWSNDIRLIHWRLISCASLRLAPKQLIVWALHQTIVEIERIGQDVFKNNRGLRIDVLAKTLVSFAGKKTLKKVGIDIAVVLLKPLIRHFTQICFQKKPRELTREDPASEWWKVCKVTLIRT